MVWKPCEACFPHGSRVWSNSSKVAKIQPNLIQSSNLTGIHLMGIAHLFCVLTLRALMTICTPSVDSTGDCCQLVAYAVLWCQCMYFYLVRDGRGSCSRVVRRVQQLLAGQRVQSHSTYVCPCLSMPANFTHSSDGKRTFYKQLCLEGGLPLWPMSRCTQHIATTPTT